MKILSPINSIKEIASSIDRHPPASMLAISGLLIDGIHKLETDIFKEYTNRGSFFISLIDAALGINVDSIISIILHDLKEDYDFDPKNNIAGLGLSESLYYLFSEIAKSRPLKVILVINNYGRIDVNLQYQLASQLRNLREKIKANNSIFHLHSIILGDYNPKKIEEICTKKSTSTPFDTHWYLGPCSLIETSEFLPNCFDEIQKEYIYELTSGCFGIIDAISKKLSEQIDCNMIYSEIEHIANNYTQYDQNIEERLHRLSLYDNHSLKNILLTYSTSLNTLQNREAAYLTGLFYYNQSRDGNYCFLRSWPLEMWLRTVWFKDTPKIAKSINQLIPPTTVINKKAYSAMMEIENILRNLVYKISAIEYDNEDTLKSFNVLGNIKKRTNKNEYITLFDYAMDNKKHYNEIKHSGHTSLFSYLDLNDLCEIILSNKCSRIFHNSMKTIFPERDKISTDLFYLRKLRNLIAHNNIITEPLLRNLLRIKKNIIDNIANASNI